MQRDKDETSGLLPAAKSSNNNGFSINTTTSTKGTLTKLNAGNVEIFRLR